MARCPGLPPKNRLPFKKTWVQISLWRLMNAVHHTISLKMKLHWNAHMPGLRGARKPRPGQTRHYSGLYKVAYFRNCASVQRNSCLRWIYLVMPSGGYRLEKLKVGIYQCWRWWIHYCPKINHAI